MGTWLNDDGLNIKFGRTEGYSDHPAGAYSTYTNGDQQVVEIILHLAKLTQTETILNDVVLIPNNAHVLWVETQTVVAAATGAAVDLGLIKSDRTTEGDYDGFLVAAPTSQMDAVGETTRFTQTYTVPASQTGTGALVGEVLTYDGYLSASCTTSTLFTDGIVRVRVAFIPNGLSATS